MLRKLWVSGVAFGLAAVSAGAWADHDRGGRPYDDDGRYDRHGGAEYEYAPVVDVLPIRRRVRVSEPVRECWDEVVHEPEGPFSSRHAGSTLLGGVIGGLLGDQFGHGHDRRAARAAGAIIGGTVGYHASRERAGYGREHVVERCEVRYHDSWEERIDGYEVTYEYAGRRHVTRMPYDPGERVRVRVDVTPVAG